MFEAQRSVLVKFVRKCRRYFATGTVGEVWTEFAKPLGSPLQPTAFEVIHTWYSCSTRAPMVRRALVSEPAEHLLSMCAYFYAVAHGRERHYAPFSWHFKRAFRSMNRLISSSVLSMAGAWLPEPADAHARYRGAGGRLVKLGPQVVGPARRCRALPLVGCHVDGPHQPRRQA